MHAVAKEGSKPVESVEAMGRAHVEFALRNPACVQTMFRADAVPLDRYPDARKHEDEGFGRRVEGINQAFANQPADVRRAIAIARWAMVHGLATLILEGRLARKLGGSKAGQRQVADKVIGTFTRLLSKNSK